MSLYSFNVLGKPDNMVHTRRESGVSVEYYWKIRLYMDVDTGEYRIERGDCKELSITQLAALESLIRRKEDILMGEEK